MELTLFCAVASAPSDSFGAIFDMANNTTPTIVATITAVRFIAILLLIQPENALDDGDAYTFPEY
ncbi:hypothetical protein IA69_21690 [Massilia sp. JS1662]|nr:hypothetical protein IA69_21690 [Massilia sp. JS1662]